MTDVRFAKYLADTADIIESVGHAVQGVFPTEDGGTSFCYTIGLTARGWSELIVLGPIEMGHEVLNLIVAHYDDTGDVPAAGDDVPVLQDDYLLKLRPCSTHSEDFPFSVARALYGDAVIGLQVMIPDDQHRYPGEDGACSLTWQKIIEAP